MRMMTRNMTSRTPAGRTGVRITPHMFRHMYATRRLAELEQSHKSSDGLNSPLKALQMELGHARITFSCQEPCPINAHLNNFLDFC